VVGAAGIEPATAGLEESGIQGKAFSPVECPAKRIKVDKVVASPKYRLSECEFMIRFEKWYVRRL
jgi:hypothetical protein